MNRKSSKWTIVKKVYILKPIFIIICNKLHFSTETNKLEEPMKHAIAHTLDICMLKMFDFLKQRGPPVLSLRDNEGLHNLNDSVKFLKLLIKAFDDVILPIHNTHHVQFLIFYFCSLKVSLLLT